MNERKSLEGNALLRFFISLVGGDYRLLLRSGRTIVYKHYVASILLVIVFVISTLSVFYATDLLFHNWKVELFMSVFISLLFGCIYVFLLTTFSKTVQVAPSITLSNATRTGFVIFMAFLISKPVEVFIFSSRLTAEVFRYKGAMLMNYSRRLDDLSSVERTSMQVETTMLEDRIKLYPGKPDVLRLAKLKEDIQLLTEGRKRELSIVKARIAQSGFLLFQIQVLARRPLSWLICLAVIILFLLPGLIIYSIPADHSYYQSRHALERKIILQEYANFVVQYRQIFNNKWGLNVERYSKYQDPPFNTVRIPESQRLTNEDFISRYLK